jgi:hypothetical protein
MILPPFHQRTATYNLILACSAFRTNLIFQKGIEMGDERSGARQSGGVNISGGTVTVGGDIVGRDKIVGTEISRVQLDQILRPIEEAVRTAPPEKQPEAMQKLEELKAQAAKGENAEDGVVAKLVKGLVGLIPGAVSAVVSAFATPLLGGIAGPVTKHVLNEIQGK